LVRVQHRKNAAYCLYCYLFKSEHGNQGGGDSFISEGFTNGKRAKERFHVHVGGHNSMHNICLRQCQDLMNQDQHIELSLANQSEQVRNIYRTRLTASVNCIRFLLHQGLAFRDHDESEQSLNQGNFIELLKFLSEHNEEINKVVLNNTPENLKLTSLRIQKDIINVVAIETQQPLLVILETNYSLF